MKRVILIFLLLLVCLTATGCTLYFGGWGTSSGQVLKVVPGEAAIPLPGVKVTYTSISDPDLVWRGQTDEAGRWMTYRLKIDRYTAKFEHAECESLEMTIDVRAKGADTPVPPVILISKASGSGSK